LNFDKIVKDLTFMPKMSIEMLDTREVRGVILGGGRGTRLLPLTREVNKHLLPVGDRPLIFYAVEQLLKADVKDILLLIDEQYASRFMEVLKDGSHLGVRSLAYVWQPPEGRGLPTAIAQVEPFCKDGKIVVACGDVIIENGIVKPVEDFMGQSDGARLVATEMENTAGYSLLETDENRVFNILFKDAERHQKGLIDLGVYMYHLEVFERIRRLIPSQRGETEIWDLNNLYVKEGKLNYTLVEGWWADVGNSIKTYTEANRRYSK
jgi:glucose-1-phosphate thymidylyltransferase